MPVTLQCPNGHKFEMTAHAFRTSGARCPTCGAVTVKRLKTLPPPVVPKRDGIVIVGRPAHPMMSMQDGETCAEVKASAEMSAAGPTPAKKSRKPNPGSVRKVVQRGEGKRLCDTYPVDESQDDPEREFSL